jgi:hypothetical protein
MRRLQSGTSQPVQWYTLPPPIRFKKHISTFRVPAAFGLVVVSFFAAIFYLWSTSGQSADVVHANLRDPRFLVMSDPQEPPAGHILRFGI